MPLSSYRTGVLFITLSALCYGMLPVTLKTIYENSQLEPTDVAIWRYILAVPIIWIATSAARSKPRTSETEIPKRLPGYRVPLSRLFILGVLYGICVLLAFFGLERLPVAMFLLLYYTYPAMVAVASLFLGQSLSRIGWIALGLTLVGAVLTISTSDATKEVDPLGVVLALAHAVSVAIFFLAAGFLIKDSRETSRNTAWQLTGTLIFLLVFIPLFGFRIPSHISVWIALLILASLCTSLPIFALTAGIQRIGPAQASIIGTLEPVVSIFAAFLFLHEPIEMSHIIGIGLILTAVILLQTQPDKVKNEVKASHNTTQSMDNQLLS